MSQRVFIMDTTLRDGEQSPGASMTPAAKLRVAKQLARLGVDIIEAGFPAASRGDFEAVQAIAREVSGPAIMALARCNPGDIERAVAAVAPAARPAVHVFISTSDLHMEHKLKMTRSQVLDRVRRSVEQARAHVRHVQFSAEDASRSDRDFLVQVFQTAVDAGSTVINIPDTVGYATPWDYGALIGYLEANVRRSVDVVLSAHCHDDLGMAVTNSLAAVKAGARQVECTVNGIGERAGNAALEEVVMAMRTRPDVFPFETGVDTRELGPTSRMVVEATGITVQANKAIVGGNAFAHESGIHQDGVLKNRMTYEIMRPADVGASDERMLVLGKHSGRHAVRKRLETLGYQVDDGIVDRVFKAFKALADERKEIGDADLRMLMA